MPTLSLSFPAKRARAEPIWIANKRRTITKNNSLEHMLSSPPPPPPTPPSPPPVFVLTQKRSRSGLKGLYSRRITEKGKQLLQETGAKSVIGRRRSRGDRLRGDNWWVMLKTAASNPRSLTKNMMDLTDSQEILGHGLVCVGRGWWWFSFQFGNGSLILTFTSSLKRMMCFWIQDVPVSFLFTFSCLNCLRSWPRSKAILSACWCLLERWGYSKKFCLFVWGLSPQSKPTITCWC